MFILTFPFSLMVIKWSRKSRIDHSRRPYWYQPEQAGLEEQIDRAEAELQRLDGLIAAHRRQGPGGQDPGPMSG